MYENLLSRFLRYVKIETRSDATSKTIPSTQAQVAFVQELKRELEELGSADVFYNEDNGLAMGTLPNNVDYGVRPTGFISHMDITDFNAVEVGPQIIRNYDGESTIVLDAGKHYTLSTKDSPNLKNYEGHTLITTGGSTLLGADDKSRIAEVMTAMETLINGPSTPRGTIKVAFGPGKEIGVEADKSDVEQFDVDFAHTVDGGPSGELQYETFSVVQVNITIRGKNVHPETVKNTMISVLQLAIDSHSQLPADKVPEKAEGYKNLSHLMALDGNPEEASMGYIIHDHDREKFEARKAQITHIRGEPNQQFDQERIKVDIYDQYYNTKEIVGKDMNIVRLAKQAMIELDIPPVIEPVHGETDGSKVSYMDIPIPNLLVGGENTHGRFELVSLQIMKKAANVAVETAELNTKS